jgi:hypothetical protein
MVISGMTSPYCLRGSCTGVPVEAEGEEDDSKAEVARLTGVSLCSVKRIGKGPWCMWICAPAWKLPV